MILPNTEGGEQMTDKEKKDFRDKVYRLLAELLADQMGGTLVSLEFIDENGKKEAVAICDHNTSI